MNVSLDQSVENLTKAFLHLQQIISNRLSTQFEPNAIVEKANVELEITFEDVDLTLFKFVDTHKLSNDEFVLLLIALAPHVQPHFFDQVIRKQLPEPGDFPQIGGVKGKNFRGFLPTGETALFLLAGMDLEDRFSIQELFSEDHFFAKKHILWLEDAPEGEPRMSGRIILSQEYIDLFTVGKVSRPKFSMRFPAQLLGTKMDWEDLVLSQETLDQIHDLETWIKYGDTLMNDWGMARKLKPGYRVLFHGPPGTGKTLTASLLGKYTGKDVYRIDLSMVVSKYIGETEKNLSALFAKAENKDWILFFDEADALFGKRTNVKDAHDKHANQEVSYLLQRVENFNGLVILASNFKNNIDEAFVRRFQSIIQFSLPKASERLQLWKSAYPSKIRFTDDVDFYNVAKKYELSGAEIMGVVQYSCLRALEKETKIISMEDIHVGVRKQFQKEGRILR